MVSVRPGNAVSALGSCILDPKVIALLSKFGLTSVTSEAKPTTMCDALFRAKG